MSGELGWREVGVANPGLDTFAAVSAADPARMRSQDLPDLMVAADRLISSLQAMQMAAVAEFARPGRAGNLDRLVDMLTGKAGVAVSVDGSVDPVAWQALLVEHGKILAGAEIAAILHQSPVGAARRVDTAVELVDELPETLTALRAGLIDVPRARVIAERTQNLPPQARRRVQLAGLSLAGSRTPGQLIPLLDRRVIAVDPAAAWKRCQRARRERCVEHHPGADGMAMIKAYLSAEHAVSVFDLLDRMAQATAGQDDRPVGARRADALVDIFEQLWTTGRVDLGGAEPDTGQTAEPAGAAHRGDGNTEECAAHPAATGPARPEKRSAAEGLPGSAPQVTPGARSSAVVKRHGRPAHFNLTMSLPAFLGLSDEPAELGGHGIIPAQLARSLRASAKSFAVVVVNDKGHALGVGSTAYLPSQAVTDQVITAAGTCRFPSCRLPAARCDLDHREPFDHQHPQRGGLTHPAGLDPGCRKHHILKTHTDWAPERADDGLTMHWTSPTGHHYQDSPRECALPHTERDLLPATGTAGDDPPDRDRDRDRDATATATVTAPHRPARLMQPPAGSTG